VRGLSEAGKPPRYTVGIGYDELEVGQELRTHGITVSESHIALFAALSGDWNVLHVNEEYAKRTIFGTRVAHGLLTLALMSGPLGMMFSGTAVAFVEASVKFKYPVKAGDTIYSVAKVAAKKDLPQYNGGLITLEGKTYNQEDIVVTEGTFKLIVTNRP